MRCRMRRTTEAAAVSLSACVQGHGDDEQDPKAVSRGRTVNATPSSSTRLKDTVMQWLYL